MTKKKQPTLEELQTEIAMLEDVSYADTSGLSVTDSRYRWQMESIRKGRLAKLTDTMYKLYPHTKPPLPDVSVKLRAWRGQRGLREAATELATALGCDISITRIFRIEGGHLANTEPDLLEKIERFLDEK